jgi:hypothetical protein
MLPRQNALGEKFSFDSHQGKSELSYIRTKAFIVIFFVCPATIQTLVTICNIGSSVLPLAEITEYISTRPFEC